MEQKDESMYDRTVMLLGDNGVERLKNSRVIVFGIGGVGGYAVEAMARAGVGHLTLVDHDVVTVSNINRQIIATRDTIGIQKTEAMRDRILTINPEAEVVCRNEFFLPENEDTFQFEQYDYVVDAVDTVTAKLTIIEKAKKENVPVISSMGAGNKLDASAFVVADIYETSVCRLARVMRRECKVRGIQKLQVVYSKEKAIDVEGRTPGSVSFVPATAGLILGGEVIKQLCKASDTLQK